MEEKVNLKHMLELLKKLSRKYPRIKQLRFIAQGLATYFPIKLSFLPRHRIQFTEDRVRTVTDSRDLARACYTIWLRFLVATKPTPNLPIESVGEIGPGDSLGVGLAALLSGSNRYYPIDKFTRSRNCDNLLIFDELVSLFRSRAPIPNDKEFPKSHPRLSSYEFPKFITNEVLKESLAEERINKIRKIIDIIQSSQSRAQIDDIVIEYPTNRPKSGIDFLFSVATMEHIDDPAEAYKRDYLYLKDGGIFAHTIGLNSHGTAWKWNGHYTYSPLVWRLIRGRVKYLINRWPHSWHVSSLVANGFSIVVNDVYREENYLSRKDLSKQFAGIPDDDLTAYSVFISGYK